MTKTVAGRSSRRQARKWSAQPYSWVCATFVKNHHSAAVRYRLGDRFGFFQHALFGIVGAAFANLDNVDAVMPTARPQSAARLR